MKRKEIKRILIFFFLINLIPLRYPLSAKAIQDSIIAVVNDDLITAKDLHEYLTTIYMQLKSSGKTEEEISRVMKTSERDGLIRLIDDKLILSEAEKRGIVIRNSVLDGKVKEIKDRYPSEQIFIQALINEGMTLSDLRKRLADQLKTKYLLEYEVKDKIFVNPHEVTEYYNSNKKQFMTPEQFDLDSIYVSSHDDPKKAKKRINQALNEIQSGQDFQKVASEYSELPSVGIITRDQLLPEIDKAVSQMKAGEISDPIQTNSGFFILKLKKILPPKQSSLDEAKGFIYNRLFQIKYRERLAKWVEELRAKAFVEIKE